MPLQRLGIVSPSANADTALVNFSAAHLVSVIAANKAPTSLPALRVTIYVVPFGAVLDAQYAYICFNLLIGQGQSFETFRFGVNPGDTLFVRATTDSASFSCVGIQQDDAVQPEDLTQNFSNKVIKSNNNNTIYLDRGTTAQRPGNAEEGFVRYNTEFEELEVLKSSTWELVGSSIVGPTGPTGPTGPAGSDGTNGTDGDATAYTPAVESDWDVTPSTIAAALDELAARLRTLEP